MPAKFDSLEKVAEGEAKAVRKRQTKTVSEAVVPTSGEEPEDEAVAWRTKELKQKLIEAERMLELRAKYADKIFCLTAVWLGVVLLMITATAIEVPDRRTLGEVLRSMSFKLPDGVLIAFITTTTINVIALFLTVGGWLFPKPIKEK